MNSIVMASPDRAFLPPVVSVQSLSRRFGNGPRVLDQLNLNIAPGEFVALLGHSGSGKSTLLRTLAGLDPVTEGNVSRPTEISVVFRKVAYCHGKKYGRISHWDRAM